MSSPLAGAEMITFFTGPRRCLRASSAFVNKPVDTYPDCHYVAPQLGKSPSDPEFPSILCGRDVLLVHACSHPRSTVDISVLSRSVSKVSSDRPGSFRVCEVAANAGFHLGTRRIRG